MKSSLTSAAPTSADLSEMSRVVSMTSRNHQPVSMKEVENQIWIYCHSNEPQKTDNIIKTQQINAKIVNGTQRIVVNQSPGRKRLINIIHNVADASKADYCEKVPEMKIDKPIENTFTARNFSRYLGDKDIKVPFFLSPSEKIL